jgi:halogenation protein CepH
MNVPSSAQPDVCVIGSGPAGSTAATFIARQGHRVLLLEKESLPVYKIGESLLPATVHGVCAMLGVSRELREAGFIRKLGGTFRWGKSDQPWTFSFSASPLFQGPTSYAYQVERLKFDTILLNNARRFGVEVRERHRVIDLVLEGDRVAGVEVAGPAGERMTVRCRYVVDASGHESTVARHAGTRVYSEFFKNIAVFGYYENGGRLPPPRSGNIFCAAFDQGWFWYIPLSDTLTSVGAVIGAEHATLLRGDHAAALQELSARCAPIRGLLDRATRVTTGPYGEVRVRKDYSYLHTGFWRPGLVLVGDAACFIDPVFSSGVHLATYSALLAARSINTRLAGALSDDQVFAEYETRYRREYGYFHDFLCAFYDTEQALDSYYWTARKVLRTNQTPEAAFASLVGGSGPDEPQLRDGARLIGARSELERRMAKGSHAAAIDRDASTTASTDSFWTALNGEGVQMQLRGQAGGVPIRETPSHPGGLIPSADGLHWAIWRPVRSLRRTSPSPANATH